MPSDSVPSEVFLPSESCLLVYFVNLMILFFFFFFYFSHWYIINIFDVLWDHDSAQAIYFHEMKPDCAYCSCVWLPVWLDRVCAAWCGDCTFKERRWKRIGGCSLCSLAKKLISSGDLVMAGKQHRYSGVPCWFLIRFSDVQKLNCLTTVKLGAGYQLGSVLDFHLPSWNESVFAKHSLSFFFS